MILTISRLKTLLVLLKYKSLGKQRCIQRDLEKDSLVSRSKAVPHPINMIFHTISASSSLQRLNSQWKECLYSLATKFIINTTSHVSSLPLHFTIFIIHYRVLVRSAGSQGGHFAPILRRGWFQGFAGRSWSHCRTACSLHWTALEPAAAGRCWCLPPAWRPFHQGSRPACVHLYNRNTNSFVHTLLHTLPSELWGDDLFLLWSPWGLLQLCLAEFFTIQGGLRTLVRVKGPLKTLRIHDSD